MNEELLQIPKRIKELREILEISTAEMAEKLNISYDEYEKYESGEKDIPISALYAIAAVLGTDCTVLMTGESPRMDSYTIVRRGDGVRVDRYAGYYIESLAFNFKNRQMEPMLVTLEEQEPEPALVMHSGQEFNLVKITVGKNSFILSEGDAIYFDPNLPHGQAAVDGRTRFLTVINE